MTTAISTNRRYSLHDKLGQGGMGAVYKATDRLTGQTVAYKQVITQTQGIDATNLASQATTIDPMALRLALAREFELLASVKHPNVINVLDYGFDDEQNSYFTMSLLDNPRTLLEAGEDQPLNTRVSLLNQLMQALAYLHRRGIVHCDLKPDNVLVAEDGTVKVLDFGLALLRSRQSSNDEVSGGTLAYMAPEVIQGEAPSFAADMYAVGVMAYQLFVGEHPFDLTNMSDLIAAVLFEEPDLDALEKTIQIDRPLSELDPDEIYRIQAENVGDHLIPFVEALLDKNGNSRMADPYAAIRLLSTVTHTPAPEESVEIRDSFLQAATFIGRENEMATLTDAMEKAVAGTGSAWLIGGESGVGKSRLINELRTRALVNGVLVLRGQEVQERASTYEVWINVLQNLILQVDVTDLETSILKPIISNIEQLLDKSVSDAPELEPQQAQERLFGTVISLFRRVDKPVVLILEDLQWSSISLELLKRLNALTSEMSLLVIGSYRNDERPDLPNELPSMSSIKLERLDNNNVKRLAISMIGEAGQNTELIDLLQRETEGNTFFLVEVMRTLAEEAGNLRDVAIMDLPKTVFAGGVQAILQRRLDALPESLLPLLQFAALMGRQLDVSTLENIASKSEVDTLLTSGANLAVLDVQDGAWRFAHDKLRDAMIAQIPNEDKPQKHREIAEAIETISAMPESRANDLAYHWREANNPQKEKHYALIAGERAYQTSNYHIAAEFLQRALELEGDASQKSRLHNLIAEVQRELNDYDNAINNYQTAIDTGHTFALIGLSRAYMDKGEAQAAIPYLEQALSTYEETQDNRNKSYALYTMHRAKLDLGQRDEAYEMAKEALDLAHDVGDKRSESLALNGLGLAALQSGKLNEARDFLSRARKIDEELGNRRSEAFSAMYYGVSYVMTGNISEGLPHIDNALSIAQNIGDRRLEALATLNKGSGYDILGDWYLTEELASRAYDLFEGIGDVRHEAISLLNLNHAYAALGGYDKALEFAQRGLEKCQEINFLFFELLAYCDLAQTSIANGQYDAAAQYIKQVQPKAEETKIPPVMRRMYTIMSEIAVQQEDWETALTHANVALEFPSDTDVHIAPLLKAVALMRLKETDDAKQAIEEASTFIAEQLSAAPEDHKLIYGQALTMAMQAITANPSELMQKILASTDAYKNAIARSDNKGVIDTALHYLSMIEPTDNMGLLAQIRILLQDAR